MLGAVEYVAPFFLHPRLGFLEPVRWANFDGGHYLSIASGGYHIYQQAFFPFYPIVIRTFSSIFQTPSVISALIISHVSFFIGLVVFYRLIIDFSTPENALWSVVLLLLFPTSFFFIAAYSESLFFVLAVGMIYALKKKKWLIAGVLGLLASATRLFGVFLLVFPILSYLSIPQSKRNWHNLLPIFLIPLGIIFYMVYLKQSVGDPLAFFHLQPEFGAERSGNTIILLPQVFWRYAKIFFSASSFSIEYAVAVFEFVSFLFSALILCIGWRRSSVKLEYLAYTFLVLVIPTLTGTLSSIPRYALSAFPLFFILGNMHNTGIKMVVAAIFTFGLIVFTSLYLSGYFVA